ncbi:MAG: ABC transporter substrate-binding protein [Gemmatimonadaceae bacterium]|nr:ABC transporter substrate-binding protein [Gemmatimonadaceae bacterium]
MKNPILLAAALSSWACSGEPPPPHISGALAWDSVEARARGSTVQWRMWRGDPSINGYVDRWVAPRLRQRYGIILKTVDGRGPEIVNQLTVERDARANGSADLVWINGETFNNLRKEALLWGPWAHRLPHALYVDSLSAIVMRDFEQPTGGWESPWGRVQFTLIYDSARVLRPPQTVPALENWIRANPGRFTHDQQFTGTTFLKSLMYALGGGAVVFQGGFSEERYRAGSQRVWSWLDGVRPSFWRRGATYPAGVADLHRLFANGEVDFTMSYNQNEVITKVRQGVLPATSRAIVLREGSIANTHYVGIPFNARNPAGAMVVANLLLSPEAQLEKLRPEVWADGTVLDLRKMPPELSDSFRVLMDDPRGVPHDTLLRYQVPEVAPEYTERLSRDWRSRIRANTR